MKYPNIEKAIFLSRPNRFIANIKINKEEVVCHVKNTGRCKELLVPGATIWVEKATTPNRKTPYDLIAVQKGDLLINMDSQVTNKAVEEWLKKGCLKKYDIVKRETTYGNSRFDFYMESKTEKAFLEVKGVTLEKDGVVSFPDAPTERGLKHVDELIECQKQGYMTYIFFCIQMSPVKYFRPNWATMPEFGEALKRAQAAGVTLLAYDCTVTPDSIAIKDKVKIDLDR